MVRARDLAEEVIDTGALGEAATGRIGTPADSPDAAADRRSLLAGFVAIRSPYPVSRVPEVEGAMLDNAVAELELAEVAVSDDAMSRRAEQLLQALCRYIPFDGAWLGLADPQHPRYTTLASAELADSTREFFESPQQALDIETVDSAGPHRPWTPRICRSRPRSCPAGRSASSRPVTVADCPYRCLLPAGVTSASSACPGRAPRRPPRRCVAC
jgi:hypothetical protein